MATKYYYRGGKDRKGVFQKAIDVVNQDDRRQKFCDRLKSDVDFRTKKLRWTKHSVDEYVAEYKKKGVCPGPNIKSEEVQMCSHLYLLGTLGGSAAAGSEEVSIITKDNEELKFPSKYVCPYHESHDAPTLPDDVCAIKGFGEAALLKIMERRLVELLDIYTYVGDVILCMNPYMYLPEMVDIAEYPNQKQYKLGVNPNSYASAHFAYWGIREKGPAQKNNSCIVSGESGAGKTVACGFILRYLAKLSNWRKQELGESVGGGVDITSLVAGVSPFLEAFGNAKTNMNDNSSRFGKFTKIWFADGKIVGADLEHYLLEKARICAQGSGERSYHIFYFLLRGGKIGGHNEVETFKLKDCDSYPLLCEGGSSLIGHGLGPEYDEDRFNNPLAEDPDDTGVRAALTAAQVSEETQHTMWQMIAGITKLLTVKFNKKGDGAEVENKDVAKDVSDLMGFPESFGDMLSIYRLKLPGGKFADKDCDPAASTDNRNALAKDIYDKMFAWLITDVCNGVLEPKVDKEAFVGLLDIFGFEVMPKNSIEQLCINFANEKLQQLFNQHIFDDEEACYKAEGIDVSMIPPHADNTPCCNLIVKKSKKFIGMFPMLDDMSSSDKNTDVDFIKKCNKKFGKKEGVCEQAKDKITRLASAQYYGDRKKDFVFNIKHFAGDVRYDGREFLAKNKDKLPPQLQDLCTNSSISYLSDLYSGRKDGKKKKKNFKTLASLYMHQLHNLAETLTATEPHYVRCVKPNDIHYRPVDGKASFDDWKVYRQLLYAGVMEVCKIKKEGYPYREKYEIFWKGLVDSKVTSLLELDSNMDPKEGTKFVADAILPKPQDVIINGEKTKKFFWTMGSTMIFGKDTTQGTILHWRKNKICEVLHPFIRSKLFMRSLEEATFAKMVLVKKWKKVVYKRKTAALYIPLIKLQNMLRAIEVRSTYKKRVNLEHAKNLIRDSWRKYNASKTWDKVRYDLGRIAEVAIASEKIQENWRQYHQYLSWYSTYKMLVHFRGRILIDKFSAAEVDFVKGRLASRLMSRKMMLSLQNLRLRMKAQAHLRGYFGRQQLKKRLKLLEIERTASMKAEGLWLCNIERIMFVRRYQASVMISSMVRKFLFYRYYKRMRAARSHARAFLIMCVSRRKWQEKVKSTISVQRTYRIILFMDRFKRKKRALACIENFYFKYMIKSKMARWIDLMSSAASRGDLETCKQLYDVESNPTWSRLLPLKVEMIPRGKDKKWKTFPLINLRETTMFSAPIHSAAISGNKELIEWMIKSGAETEIRDMLHNTPMHSAAAMGDDALSVCKHLYRCCTTMSFSGDSRWIISLDAMNVNEKTVMDEAFSAKKHDQLIAWLLEQNAQALIDVESFLEQMEEKKRRKEALVEQRATAIERLEEEERKNDPAYTYLMLDSRYIDPVSQKIKEKRHLEAESRMEKERQSKMHAAATLIQAKVRAYMFLCGKSRSYITDLAMQQATAEKHLRSRLRARRTKRKKLARRKAMQETSKMEQRRLRELDELSDKRCAAMRERLEAKVAERRERTKARQLRRAREATKRGEEKVRQGLASPMYQMKSLLSGATKIDDIMNKKDVDTRDHDEVKRSVPAWAQEKIMKDKNPAYNLINDYINEKKSFLPQKKLATRSVVDVADSMKDSPSKTTEAIVKAQMEQVQDANHNLEEEIFRLKEQIAEAQRMNDPPIAKNLLRTPSDFKQVLIQTLLAFNSIAVPAAVRGWFYQDDLGEIFGPYSGPVMRQWLMEGHLRRTLLVRLGDLGSFIPLYELFPDLSSAFEINVYENLQTARRSLRET
eukprot:g4404.t1